MQQVVCRGSTFGILSLYHYSYVNCQLITYNLHKSRIYSKEVNTCSLILHSPLNFDCNWSQSVSMRLVPDCVVPFSITLLWSITVDIICFWYILCGHLNDELQLNENQLAEGERLISVASYYLLHNVILIHHLRRYLCVVWAYLRLQGVSVSSLIY